MGTFDLILDTKQDLLNLRFFYCLTSTINAYIKFFEGDNLQRWENSISSKNSKPLMNCSSTLLVGVWKKECELKVNLLNEEEDLPPQVADKDVLNNHYQVRSAEIMMEARKLV